jgi:hypothetical protein
MLSNILYPYKNLITLEFLGRRACKVTILKDAKPRLYKVEQLLKDQLTYEFKPIYDWECNDKIATFTVYLYPYSKPFE